jgi:hypothetical protein
MHIDKELNIYVDDTSTAIAFRGYDDLFVMSKQVGENDSIKMLLSVNQAIALRDFLNYCHPKP